jgi:isoleucyl-tRNA synthetase
VPIPVFYHKETNEPLITPETLAHVEALVAAHPRGSDVWFEVSRDISHLDLIA